MRDPDAMEELRRDYERIRAQLLLPHVQALRKTLSARVPKEDWVGMASPSFVALK